MQPKETRIALEALKGFSGFVDDSRTEWNVPGLALAIVHGDETIYAEGFGLRDPDKGLPMKTDTLYRMASNTKAFTAMAVALLVDEGKIGWDTPVKRLLPWFKLHDPYATEHVTLRDLLCHRTGLPVHESLMGDETLDRKRIVGLLQYLEPSCDMRTKLQYNNHMYMLAGFLVESISGHAYERFVQERILQPLGMNASHFSFTRSMNTGNFAECFWRKDGVLQPYTHEKAHDPDLVWPWSPAGGLNSTAIDMAAWVTLQMNRGKYRGTQLVSEACLVEMHSPQMIDNWPRAYEELGHSSCGLGWFIWTYRGHKVVLHGGFFGSQVMMIPSKRIGVVFMPTLGMSSSLHEVVCFNVFDRLLGLDPLPWQRRLLDDMAEQLAKEKADKDKAVPDRKEGTRPSHPLDDYCGVFAHPGYGRIAVKRDGDVLTAFPNAAEKPFTLRHYHYDTFELVSEKGEAVTKGTFHADSRGVVSSFSAPLEPAVRDIVFTRGPGSS